MVFDKNLYAFDTSIANTEHENFLERLVRHEAGNAPGGAKADAMLTRFTRDLWKIAKDGGLSLADSNVSKALTAFAMQMYYESPNATDVHKTLFTEISGGIHFDRGDVSASLNQAKGYTAYFLTYLQNNFSGNELNEILAELPSIKDWYIQAGTSGMASTGGTERVFMLGGANSDTVTGSSLADILAGGAGKDILVGGSGADILLGGADADILYGNDGAGGDTLEGGDGFDTYYADNGDTIRDSDGQGTVYLNNKQLTLAKRKEGEVVWTDNIGNTYALRGNRLEINDPLVIEGFSNDELGIHLDEEPDDPMKKIKKDFGAAEKVISPIILDLDGDGVETVGAEARTYFDHAGDGFAESTGWAAPDDGLLVYDRNGDGRIGSGAELFGSETILENGKKAPNGYAALSELDNNHDGKIDNKDSVFAKLCIWKDANSDGVSQATELLTLTQVGVQSLDIAYNTLGSTDAQGNIHQLAGSYTRTDGSKAVAEDIWFQVDSTFTIAEDQQVVSIDIAAQPNARGYGQVYDLHQAMMRDSSGHLRSLVAQFVTQKDSAARKELTAQIIFAWTGAENMAPDSRGYMKDARQLYAIEAFLGEGYVQESGYFPGGAGPVAAESLADIFGNLCDYVYAELMAQTHFKSLYDSVGIVWNSTAKKIERDVSNTVTMLHQLYDADPINNSVIINEFGDTLRSTGEIGLQVLDALRSKGNPLDSGFTGLLTKIGANDLIGDINDNKLKGGSDNDALYGYGGNDSLYGNEGSDYLDGGAGNDSLQGGTGNDVYQFNRGGGQDIIFDRDSTVANLDIVRFGAGIAPSDIIVVRSGYDLVLKINGSTDQLTLQNFGGGDNYSIERIDFSDGTKWSAAQLQAQMIGMPVVGTDSADTLIAWANENASLQGKTGDDILIGFNGNDILDGGAGRDILRGALGNDIYLFNLGYGQDTIYDNDSTKGNIDTVRFGAGIAPSDITFARSNNNLVLGIKGTNDQLSIGDWGDSDEDPYHIERVTFTDGSIWDTAYLEARATTTLTIGTNGNDVLEGDIGNNILDGGAGNDTLQGGTGNDTYLFNLGGGQDTIYDSDSTVGNLDILQFGTGITPGDITVGRSGRDMLLGVKGTGDQVKIQNWGMGDSYHIERVEFANGTVFDAALLQSKIIGLPVVGTIGNDTLQAWADENATLQGMGGNDTLSGGLGNDVLDGGTGNDSLQGGVGNDIYLFNLGGGQDTLYDADATQGNLDTIRFGAGIAPSDITFVRSGKDMVLGIKGTSDQIKIGSWGYGANSWIERLEFVNGTTLDAAFLQAQIAGVPLIGSAGSDTLQAWSGENATLRGLEGNDNLYGSDGNDTLNGGGGNDVLQGSKGNDVYLFNLGDGQDTIYDADSRVGNLDTLQFGAGITASNISLECRGSNLVMRIQGTNDQLTVQSWREDSCYRLERVAFADGTSWDKAYLQGLVSALPIMGTIGNDTLYGDVGNDIFNGSTGSDTLIGREGNDVYLFNQGGGQDTIDDFDVTIGNLDTIRFGAGIAASDITIVRSGTSLVFKINNTSDQITVKSWFDGDYRKIERVEYANGTIWNAAYLQALVSAIPVMGTGGNDTLYGDDGSNVLDGKAGNDVLYGRVGNDTYLFNRGDGQDSIIDIDKTAGNIDTISFGSGISSSDISFSRSGDALLLSINGSGDQIKISSWNQDNGSGGRIERVTFADGTTWNEAFLQSQIAAIPIIGTSGIDTLYGDSGNDTLDGGAGNDILRGGNGNDAYLFGRGSGQDSIYDVDQTLSNTDVLRLGANILPTDVTVSFNSSGDLLLSIIGTTDVVTLKSWLLHDSYKVEKVIFANGTTWGVSNLNSMLATPPSEGVNYILGTPGSDVIDALGGNDLVSGGAGNDSLRGGSGDDVLLGDGGADLLYGGDGADTLYADLVTDDSASDLFDGGAGNDTIQSTGSNDLIIGGTGTDSILVAERGNDVLLFNRGDGQDACINSSTPSVPQSAVSLGGGITYADLAFSKSGSTLVLDLGNGDSIKFNSLLGFFNSSGPSSTPVKVLQLIVETMPGYSASATDPLLAKRIQQFDFVSLVSQFEAALVADPTVTKWQLAPHLSEFSLGGSDTQALGGAMAYQYGKSGNLSSMTDVAISTQLNDTNFGIKSQSITGSSLTLLGTASNDVLIGGVGNDTLNGGTGADTMIGGAGNDTYVVDNTADVVTENASEGTDLVLSSVTYTLAANVESLTLTGTTAINGTGNALNNVLTGNAGNNTLTGGVGNDTLDGGAGADILVGGLGDDSYFVDNASDVVTENASEGSDLVQASITYTLAANVENLTLTGIAAINGTGNALNNVLTGNAGNNTLDGGAGADTLVGGVGNDTYVVDNTADVVTENASEGTDLVQSSVTYTLAANVENLTLTGALTINGTGNALNNVLTGNAGNNKLDGGAGADTLVGSTGNDTYVVDNTADVVTENASEGTDLVQSSVTYTLAANIENLTLTGTTAINGTGNTLNNVLTGNAGNNKLDGGAGADTLVGGAGNDTYVVDNTADVVTENASEGTDLIQSSVTYTLAANVENLTLTGTTAINGTGNALNNVLTGNAGNNTLTGGVGNDTLDGGAGADILVGSLGDDSYFVDNASDVVTENASEGTDLVQSSVTYALAANVENLTLTGTTAINGTGNALNNVLTGNAGNNTLDGGAGADTLVGGAGNDTYVVDNTADVVTENASEGTDLIQSSVTYTLAANVENLTLTGTTAINGTGNALNNVLTGNAGNNTLTGGVGNDTLDGGAGADILVGGLGDDSYFVDNASDVVTENASEGSDLVQASITYTLAANVENLTLTGIAAINGTGNALNNVLTGNAGNNTLTGGSGNDTLDGVAGADILVGGLGDDSYFVDNASDVVTENASEGTDLVQASVTYALAANIENLTLTGTTAINGTGNALNNALTGNAGNNTLDGGAGADTLVGGIGNDTYVVDNTADVVTENASEGTDLVQSSVTYALAANVENLTLTGTTAINGTGNALNNVLTGNAANNTLTGGSGNDTLDGVAGADILVGGLGDDSYFVDNASDVVTENASEGTDLVQASVTYALAANVENLTLTGTAAINGTGNALNNVLTGNAGNNTLDGGAGADTLVGRVGNDIYVVDNTADVVTESASEGTDLVQASVTYTLAANVENLTLTGTAAINGTGNALNNVLTGNAGNNTLDGGAGADTLVGRVGNDIYVVDNTADVVTESASEGTDLVQASVTYTLAANVENLTLTGTAAINGTGNALNNVLSGNAGNNTLDGGAGADTLVGRVGNDIYVVDNTADVVTESASEGTDLVQASVTYTLAANVENLTLTGTAAINGTGNALNNVLTGNAGNNTLDGGAGADTLVGRVGNDIYVVDNTADVVTESASEGTDLVQASVTYTLAANVENLTLTGTTAINGTGNALNNVLTGNAGNNTLDGGAGADTLVGRVGNDIYVVDNTADVVTESASEGTDLVQASVTYALATNVENLTLTGTTAINGTGNALNNVLTGNAGNNTLDGGAGNDTYVVDNTADVATEAVSEGTDLVQSSVTYTLATNVENLTLTGTTAINGTGNALDNVLIGNSGVNTLTGGAGNDTLDGGTGADKLLGGLGDDTYFIDNASDIVTENANEGFDIVNSTITLTLAANAEALFLSGTTAINGTGNALNNLVRGNSAVNTLNGGAGNDILEGGAGNDILTDTSGTALFNGGAGDDSITGGTGAEIYLGGLGNDTYTTAAGNDIILFNKGDGQDTFATGGTGSDTISLGGGISYADLSFSKATNDLVLKIGTSDQITFKNWYVTTPSKPVANLQVIAEAMAGFTAGGSDPLKDQKVEEFNFAGLVGAFDTARAANTSLTSWALTNALTNFQLAGSDSAALGGDIAYQYGKNGTLAGIGATAALNTLSDTALGSSAQTLSPLAGLQTGSARLS
ncbi:calcium-binding protein [Quatrionicoccus australiensis]|uniref:calcium-binding protein n=1 Tax=Quatrionicoccus australiensis TaxID=138118 RepID=UPI00299EE0CE|nr:calcium-binding protein [Quatrionicoccus australiensis]